MKKSLFAMLALSLCFLLVASCARRSDAAPSGSSTSSPQPGDLTANQIAKNLSMITGVAISPLLGVSVVGCWQYYHTPLEQRSKLSWYSDPMFFIPAFILVGLCFIKDCSGIVLPAALKKPFDVLETVEHKISGLVATGAFVPLIVTTFGSHISTNSASLGHMGFATIGAGSVAYDTLMIPISMVAFFIVFLASNAINILILLSPFSTIDLALKSFRTSILASVALTAWANPWVGATWAVAIIIFSWFIAGWSFRLSHFGLVFVWDFLTLRRHRFTPDKAGNNLFLSRKLNKVPARTYGRLTRNDKGELIVTYRPWLVLASRTLVLPEGKYCVGEGLLYSEIMRLEGDDTRAVLLLPPRYRSHEQELVGIYGLVDVRPSGLRAVWRWLRGSFGFKPQPTVN